MGISTRYLSFVLFVLGMGGLCFGQETQYVHFTTEDGLPSPETYFVHEDIYGYIWVGTDRGLSRYDGFEFTNFTTGNSDLTNNTIFKCYEAPNHDLWFTCYDGSITIYDVQKRELKPFEFNDSLQSWFSHWPKCIVFDTIETFIYPYNWHLHFAKITRSTNSITKESYNYEPGVRYSCLIPNKLRTVYIENKNKNTLVFTDYSLRDTIPIDTIRTLHEEAIKIGVDVYLPLENYIYRIVRGEIHSKYNFQSSINFLDTLSDGQLVVGTSKGVFLCSRDFRSVNHIFRHSGATKMCTDLEGGIWVSTISSGVLRFHSNLGFKPSVRYVNSSIISLCSNDSVLLIGGNHETIYEVNSQLKISKILSGYSDGVNKYPIKSILKYKNSFYTTGGFQIDYSLNRASITRLPAVRHVYNIYPISDNSFIAYGQDLGYYVLDSIWRHFKTPRTRFTSFLKTNNGIWLGSPKGLFYKEDVSKSLKKFFPNTINTTVTSLCASSNSLFIGTYEGLFIQIDTTMHKLGSHDGLPSNIVNAVCFENDSSIWVGTNKGLSLVTIANRDSRPRVVLTLNKDDGLLSNFIYAIEKWRGAIWLGTDKGLFKLPPELSTVAAIRPRMNIEHLLIDNAIFQPTKSEYRHSQTEFTIKYVGICFRKPEKNFYRYRLTKYGETPPAFHYGSTNTASFNNLTKGKYVFEIACRNKNNVWSETQSYTFRVLPHWTQSWFAYGLICLGIIWFGLYLLRWRAKNIKSQSVHASRLHELEVKFAESELASLRNQMNPHFVFNALNSIQSFVLENDINMATNYISRFSKLMRSSLQYSRNERITLEEEIEFLNGYLQIEQSRFPERFNYSVTVSDELDVELIEIPPLLIQPIVENAVKHAFSEDSKNGRIDVSFDIDDEFLICVIKDTGVGIYSGRKKKSPNHESLGLKVLMSRLDLIYNEGDLPHVDVKDLSQHGQNNGTLITIKLPLE